MAKKDNQLLIRLTEDEDERIRENAKAADKTVAAYLREVGCHGFILKYNYQEIIDHTHQITSLRNAINQLIYTIRRTGEYVPADLEFILDKMVEITKSENKFINLMLDEQEKKLRVVRKETRRIVRAELLQKERRRAKTEKG